MRATVIANMFCLLGFMFCKDLGGKEIPALLDNNLRCVDLSDLTSYLPLKISQSIQILWRTEAWEHNTYDRTDRDSVGFPSVVKNDRGKNPDGKYYLYYAHHDPCSGIGCAIADSIEGPYRKLASLDTKRRDSIVLANPHYPILNPPKEDPSHYSSPCVVWNNNEKLWFMYFHYYNHYHKAWETEGKAGYGNQMTALATCPDLSSHTWTILKDQKLGKISVWDIVPVLPTTKKKWMDSESSYHSVQQLVNGQWLAFLRGRDTSANLVTQLGFATSADGKKWNYFPENPVIHILQNDSGGIQKGICRPCFVGYLGKNKSGKNEYLLAWTESPATPDVPRLIYGYTTDFIKIRRDPRGYVNGEIPDGAISPWREGNKLYLFSGKYLHVITLPVASNGLHPIKKDKRQTLQIDKK